MAVFFYGLGLIMRSLFWRVLGAFWLALILTGLLTFLLTRLLNQDAWIQQQHPGFAKLAEQWLVLYEQNKWLEAQQSLQNVRQKYRISIQVFDETGQLIAATSRRQDSFRGRGDSHHPPSEKLRRLTQEISSKEGDTFLFVYRIPQNELAKWQLGHRFGPLVMMFVAFIVLTLISLLLTFSITRPLMRLRHAVHELGETAYQQTHLAKLAKRKDELGMLAADFNKMGQRLQNLLTSQRQLLRDVSHELRSPLARLQVGIALAERASKEKQEALWPKLTLECQRLDALIDEILVLARLEQEAPNQEKIELCELLQELENSCELLSPDQKIKINCPKPIDLYLAKNLLQRALNNLLGNALRFNPVGYPIEVNVSQQDQQLVISIRDYGTGVSEDLLTKITQPFTRAPNQEGEGYGLGLTITERAIEQLGGKLILANHPEQGFIAKIQLPYR